MVVATLLCASFIGIWFVFTKYFHDESAIFRHGGGFIVAGMGLATLVGLFTVISSFGQPNQPETHIASGQVASQQKPPPPVKSATKTNPDTTALYDYDKLEADALRGNYQAQRNVSYWLSGGMGVPPTNPILGCAWRIVILDSGSLSVNETDASNKTLYCNQRLTPDELYAAQAQADTLKEVIARNRAR